MYFKNIISLFTLSMMLLPASCSKSLEAPSDGREKEGLDETQKRTLTFTVADPSLKTKANPTGETVNINEWTLLLYNKGELIVDEGYSEGDYGIGIFLENHRPIKVGHATGANQIKMDIDEVSGTEEYNDFMYIAIANGMSSGVTSAFENGEGAPSLTIGDDDPSAPLMFGTGSFGGSVLRDQNVVVVLSRTMNRISVSNIKNDLLYSDASITLKGIYLINAYERASCSVDWAYYEYAVPDPGLTVHSSLIRNPAAVFVPGTPGWPSQNGSTFATGTMPSMMYESFTTVLAKGETDTNTYNMYCYPSEHYAFNPDSHTPLSTVKASSKVEDYWTSRCTRAAILAEIGGVEKWYPITIPFYRWTGGFWFEISAVNLQTSGSDSPDVESTEVNITFSLTVRDWTGTVISENI